MYRYRRGTQISLSRCFLASALARSRKLFPELFGIVMEFQYSNSVPHQRRRCWTNFEDIIYIFLFFLSRGQYSRFFSYFCQVLPSFSQINFRQPSSSRLDGKNLPNNISRGTRVVHIAQAGKVSRSRAEFFLHVSTFLLLLLLRAPTSSSPFFFSFPRNTWARVVACV